MIHEHLVWLARASWQASALAAVVLTAQWILGRRLSAGWRCNLWLIVVCRFLLPFSLPSQVSVFNLVSRGPAAVKPAAVAPTGSNPSLRTAIADEAQTTATIPMSTSQAAPDVTGAGKTLPPIARARAAFRPSLPLLWAFGAGALVIGLAASSIRLTWRLRTAVPVEDGAVRDLLNQCAEEMGVGRAVFLVESGAVGCPALHGVWRPKLILPPGVSRSLSAEQLRFVFLHEMAHVRRWDIAVGWLMTGVQILHWFNPVAWLLARQMRDERELACDALVLSYAGAGQRKPYGETILHLAQGIRRPAFAPGMVGITRGAGDLRRRMRLIADFTPSTRLAGWPAVVFALVAVVGLTDPVTVREARAGGASDGEGWQKLADADVAGRSGGTAVWTGTEMIVYGGEGLGTSLDDGARFNLAENNWTPLPRASEPDSRTQHSAVWTGREMIVWGGFGGVNGVNTNRFDGACYDPRTDAWRPTSTTDAPQARFQHTAVWTGREMLVWGGYTDAQSLYHGAYNNAYLNSGGAYDPARDTWRDISTAGAPAARFNHVALWTGDRMIIWGGNDATKAFNDGGLYDPATGNWQPINQAGAPSPRKQPLAVWTGKEMIVWGGASRDDRACYQDGARYNPATDRWTPISTNGAPIGRVFANAVWTGSKMVFWGGVNDVQSGTVGPQPWGIRELANGEQPSQNNDSKQR